MFVKKRFVELEQAFCAIFILTARKSFQNIVLYNPSIDIQFTMNLVFCIFGLY